MLGLNLLVGKRDADLPLACHSALFRNRPHSGRQDMPHLVLMSDILSTSGAAPLTPEPNLALCDSYVVTGRAT